jgi:hypothetical protein
VESSPTTDSAILVPPRYVAPTAANNADCVACTHHVCELVCIGMHARMFVSLYVLGLDVHSSPGYVATINIP